LKATVGDDDGGPVLELDHDQAPVFRSLGGGLLVNYVVDRGTHFVFVTNGDLTAQGFSTERLHEVGLANLARAAADRGVEVHPHESVFAVVSGGNLEASLILLDDLWDEGFRQFVSGSYAVAIPSRDVLAFADAADPAACSQLRAVVDRVWPGGDHLLVQRLFTRESGVWKSFAD
jgi:uncharacterized protein YtpQ (UPF0354 family)